MRLSSLRMNARAVFAAWPPAPCGREPRNLEGGWGVQAQEGILREVHIEIREILLY